MAIQNAFYEITSFTNLIQAEKDCSASKKEHKERMMYHDNLEENTRDLSEMLRAGNVPKTYYRSFYVYVPKVRKVIYIDFRSKIIQRAIYNVLNPRICKNLIEDTYSCIAGRGQLAAMQKLYGWFQKARTSGQKWYYYKFDIAKFFYRIDHKILMDICAKKIHDKRTLDLIRYYVENESIPFGMPVDADQLTIKKEDMLYDVGIPIGGGLSHMLGNMYLDPLDQFCKRVLGVKRYIRYMDDIILMHTDKAFLQECGRKMSVFIRDHLHLEFNRKCALRPASAGCEFVGYIIYYDHVILRKQTTLRIKRVLRTLGEQYRNGLKTFQEINRTVQCYLAMMSHCNCKKFQEKLLNNFILTRASPDMAERRIVC